ncbi:MAG: hypothetical protein JO227_21780 [Acetobacteraceae bacterium]|nr:hypothetical protein [Acetobacteraceae bacterium]
MPDGSSPIMTELPPESESQSTPVADPRIAPPPCDGVAVAQIKEGGSDSQGRKITRVYTVRPGEYAVYLAGDVRIEYSDNFAQEVAQRARVISAIGKTRAEITSLLVGWGEDQRRVFDCKLALALELALEGKTDEARTLVEEAKGELIQERAAAGRLQYIGFTALWCLPLLAILWGVHTLISHPVDGDDLIMAGQAGLMGAAFSIALAVRTRTVALDTDRWSNAFDGLLRLAIGVLSGGVLLLLLSSGVVPKLTLGDAQVLGWTNVTWKGVLVVGFLAGFLERLVPDLLDKAAVLPVGTPGGQRA